VRCFADFEDYWGAVCQKKKTGILIAAGRLNADDAVTRHVPQLKGTGFEGVTVQHLLNMCAGSDFAEEYYHGEETGSPGMRRLCVAGGWHPRDATKKEGGEEPASIYDFLTTLRSCEAPGTAFRYQSSSTECLQWVLESATGLTLPELTARFLWSRLGCEHQGHWTVDAKGAAMASGGFSASARDLARFGVALLHGGRNLAGESVIPSAWIAATRSANDSQRRRFRDAMPYESFLSGYTNGFWHVGERRQCLTALGIHGQMVLVHPEADLVIVKLSSLGDAFSGCDLYRTFEAFEAIVAAAQRCPIERCRLHTHDAGGWRPPAGNTTPHTSATPDVRS